MNMQELRAKFEGRVQGVGFRMTVAECAESYAVVGRVCNMSDSSVHLVSHGELEELQKFHQAILLRMSRNVVSHHETWSEVKDAGFKDFRISPDDSI